MGRGPQDRAVLAGEATRSVRPEKKLCVTKTLLSEESIVEF